MPGCQDTLPGHPLADANAAPHHTPRSPPQGTHTAMKSGMLAAEAAFEELSKSKEGDTVRARRGTSAAAPPLRVVSCRL